MADYCIDQKDKKAEPAVPLSVLSRKLYDTTKMVISHGRMVKDGF